MSYLSSSTEFKAEVISVIRSQKELDAKLTKLGANAIYNALTEVKAGRPGTSIWANYLLYMSEQYSPDQAKLLRQWLCNYGPFNPEAKERNLTLFNETVIVKTAVKFVEKKQKALFSEQEPEWYADRCEAIDFRTWKKVNKEETKVTKTDEEKREEILKKLENLKKQATKVGLTITDKPVVAGVPTFNELVSILGRMAQSTSLSKAELDIVKILLDLAIEEFSKVA